MRLALIAATLVSLSCALSAQAQQLRVGIVNSETVIQQMPEAKEADAKMNEVIKLYRDSVELIQREFQAKLEQYEKQKTMMTPEARAKEEEMLLAIRQRAQVYYEEKFGNTGELARRREELLSPLRAKIESAISKVAKDEKISLVLDKAAAGVVYFDDKLDITFKVLDTIKRETK